MKVKKTLKKIDESFMNWGKRKEKAIKEYLEKAPERRQEKIQRLKDQLEIEKLRAEIREEKEKGIPKKKIGELDFGLKF